MSATVVGRRSIPQHPFFSVKQLLVNERHRATTIAIIMMLLNLIGVGLGSLLDSGGIGLVSNSVAQAHLFELSPQGGACSADQAILYLHRGGYTFCGGLNAALIAKRLCTNSGLAPSP